MAVTVNTPSIAYFTGNPMWFECESDQLGSVENLRMQCLIQVHNLALTYRAIRIYETVKPNGKFLFNIGPVIQDMVRDWYDLPDFINNNSVLSTVPVIAELSFIEVYEGAEHDQANEITRIVNGGLQIEQLDVPNDWWTVMEIYTDGGDPTKIPFLTNKPIVSKFIPGTPEFLYYYNAIDYGFHTMTFCIECFDKYGNSLDVLTDVFAMNYEHLITMFNVGKMLQARFDVAPDDGHYEVWIEDVGNRISEKRTYYVDNRYYSHIRTLTFQNKKGGFDVLNLVGVDEQGGLVEQSVINKEYLQNQPISAGLQTTTRKKIDRKIKKNSGILLKSERTWLADLMESKLVFEIINFDKDNLDKAELLPIVIQNKEMPVINSQEFMGSLLIEWTY